MPRVSPQSLLAPRSFNVLPASLDSARLFVLCSPCPSAPADDGRENRMAGFLFRLERTDGTPAEPSSLSSAVSNWGSGP
jgi:hypothetical protein